MNNLSDKTIKLEEFQVKLSELKGKEFEFINSKLSIEDAFSVMSKKKLSMLIVEGESKKIGFFSLRDYLLRCDLSDEEHLHQDVRELVFYEDSFLRVNDTMLDALQLMRKRSQRYILTLDEKSEKLNKVISAQELIKFIYKFIEKDFECLEAEETFIGDIYDEKSIEYKDADGEFAVSHFLVQVKKHLFGEKFVRVDENTLLVDLIQKMKEEDIYSALIVRYETTLVGIVKEIDLITQMVLNKNWRDIKVSSVMVRDPHFISNKSFIIHGINKLIKFNRKILL